MFGIPERTWRRQQARARAEVVEKGPWPAPVRQDGRVVAAVRAQVSAHPTWGHRRVRALVQGQGIEVSEASVLRIMREEAAQQARPARTSASRSTAGGHVDG